MRAIYQQAISCKLPFIKHYMKLHEEFTNADACWSHYVNLEKSSHEERILSKSNEDRDDIYGTYTSINANLTTPTFYKNYE